jgi:hypothetical protein
MNALHAPCLLAQAQAVPFTLPDAVAAEKSIMGRYTRTHLRFILKSRRQHRRNLAQAIAGKHLLMAMEYAALAHSMGVQAVMLIRRHSRNIK